MGPLGVPLLGTSLDPSAEAYLRAMTTRPNWTRALEINALVKALKGSGVWAKRDAIYLHAAHDAQAARLNLKAPGTFTATLSGTPPTFTADRGFTGDGAAAYVDTNFSPADASSPQFGLNSHNLAVYINSAAGGSSTTDIGNGNQRIMVQTGGGANVIQTRSSSTTNNSGTVVVTAPGRTSYSRNNANDYAHLKNGAVTETISQASAAIGVGSIFVLALNNGGTPASFSSRRAAYAAMGGYLTPAEDLAEHTALLSYLTAIGAN